MVTREKVGRTNWVKGNSVYGGIRGMIARAINLIRLNVRYHEFDGQSRRPLRKFAAELSVGQ